MLLWYWQESIQTSAVKPSLGDSDTHRLSKAARGINRWDIQNKGVPPSCTFLRARADCWGTELKILVLVFAVFNFSYCLRPEYVFLWHCFQCDMLWCLRLPFKTLAGFFYICAFTNNHGMVLEKGRQGRPCGRNCKDAYTPPEDMWPGDGLCLSQCRAGSSSSWDVKCRLFPYYQKKKKS